MLIVDLGHTCYLECSLYILIVDLKRFLCGVLFIYTDSGSKTYFYYLVCSLYILILALRHTFTI